MLIIKALRWHGCAAQRGTFFKDSIKIKMLLVPGSFASFMPAIRKRYFCPKKAAENYP